MIISNRELGEKPREVMKIVNPELAFIIYAQVNHSGCGTPDSSGKNGINLIDTAEYYGHGHSEELVGKAIKDFEREYLFIISTVWPVNLHYKERININCHVALTVIGPSLCGL